MRYFFTDISQESQGSPSGQSVFDQRVISSLGNQIDRCPISLGARSRSIPLWRRGLIYEDIASKPSLHIVSHEMLGELCGRFGPTCFIVHNYFPGLVAKSQLYQALFRVGAKRFFDQCFSKSDFIVFLSHFDLENAKADFPNYECKMRIFVPGIKEVWTPPLERRGSVNIGETGSNDWLLKGISDRRFWRLVGRSVCVEKLDPMTHYMGVIKDDFNVGFKLKLMELAQNFQRIISFCDLSAELEALQIPVSFAYVRSKAEFFEAYHNFCEIGDYSLDEKLDIKRAVEKFRWSGFSEVLR